MTKEGFCVFVKKVKERCNPEYTKYRIGRNRQKIGKGLCKIRECSENACILLSNKVLFRFFVCFFLSYTYYILENIDMTSEALIFDVSWNECGISVYPSCHNVMLCLMSPIVSDAILFYNINMTWYSIARVMWPQTGMEQMLCFTHQTGMEQITNPLNMNILS